MDLLRRIAKAAARCLGVATVLVCQPVVPAVAHGDLDVQIEAVTRQLENSPHKAELYLKRGELHRAHQDYDAALADYERAATLNPELGTLDLVRGKALLEAGWSRSATAVLDRFLTRHPDHAEGLTTRARARVRSGEPLAAADDYRLAIEHGSRPTPSLYVERARALAQAGSNHVQEAIRSLDEGIRKIGPLVVLELEAIDLEVELQEYEAALRRVDRAAAQSARQESWLAKRGDILKAAGRSDEARAAFQAALRALQQLPPHRRNVPAMKELHRRLVAEAQSLSPGS